MREIKVTWKMAIAISRWHTLVTGAITSALFLIGLIISYVALRLHNPGLTFVAFYALIIDYRSLVIPVILVIHFIPVNLYGIKRVLKHRFPTFKLMAVLNEETTD